MEWVQPDDEKGVVADEAVHSPVRHRTNLELPRFQICQLVTVNSRRAGEAVFLGRPVEIDDMPVLVVVLIAEVFLRPTAVDG